MASVLDAKNARADIAALHDPHVETMRPLFVDFARALATARDPSDVFRLQEGLLGAFAARQDVAANRRTQADKERDRLAALVRRRPKATRSELVEQQEMLATLKHQDRRDQLVQHIVRVIADGMAWRLMRCDRYTITIFGSERRVGRLAPPDGFAAERSEARRLWAEEGLLAIHNDLTNCLRSGDLTVLFDWPPRAVDFREVKAHGRAASGSAQARRLAQKRHLSFSGVGTMNPEEPRVQARRLEVQYRTHLDHLPDLMRRAKRDGYADEHVSDSLSVAAIDYRVSEDERREPDEVAKRVARSRGWDPESENCFGTAATVTRLLERHHAEAYFAPVSIFPLDAAALVDLLFARTDYIVWLTNPT